MDIQVEGIQITPLKIIEGDKGNVMHAMKSIDSGFEGFAEAYFSTVNKGEIKGWKKHKEMTLNLVVPVGQIQFFIFDDREASKTFKKLTTIAISILNFYRLTISPNLWVAFQGLEQNNMLLNIANKLHDPNESENRPLLDPYFPIISGNTQ